MYWLNTMIHINNEDPELITLLLQHIAVLSRLQGWVGDWVSTVMTPTKTDVFIRLTGYDVPHFAENSPIAPQRY